MNEQKPTERTASVDAKIQAALKTNGTTETAQLPVTRLTNPFTKMVDTYFNQNSSFFRSLKVDPQVMARLVIQASKRDEGLIQCDFGTIVGGILQANSLGLEVNSALGEAVLVPFRNNEKKRVDAEFIIEYKGLIKLAMNHPKINNVYAHEVYENDAFSYEYGSSEYLTHIPCESMDKGALRCFYAIAKLEKGNAFVVMSVDEVDYIRDTYSPSYRNAAKPEETPWGKDYIAMGKKTAIRKLMNFLPKTKELGEAMQSDSTVQELDPSKKIN
jgi:recombination protein RecT